MFAPEEIGPMDVQVPNGVVDIAVADEAEAVRVAKQYLSYFQGPLSTWECADQRWMRRIVPENRLRVYDIRSVIATLTDTGTVLELRPQVGVGMITALVRVQGRPLGVIANNPRHLGGAIDADGADRAARFMQLCDAFELPLLYLCDTPGGPGGAAGGLRAQQGPEQRVPVRHRRDDRPGRLALVRGESGARGAPAAPIPGKEAAGGRRVVAAAARLGHAIILLAGLIRRSVPWRRSLCGTWSRR